MLCSLAVSIALALVGVSSTSVAHMHAAPAAANVTTQLPRNVRPTHYDVAIVPHAQAMTFDGKVAIGIDVLEPTASITLNAVDMTFSSVQVVSGGAKGRAYTPKVTVDAQAQTATFTFAQPLGVGSYTLAIDYSGKIGTQANGLFAIDYDTKAGKKRALYTQFENSDARKFIPSWDEPSYKTTFDLTTTVPSGQMAVSNMPAADTTDLHDGNKRVHFRMSPKMSTYLLFFGLGDFDRTTAKAGNTEVGVVTQAGLGDQGKFALASSADVLREYNDYFATPFPLPKLDNIASPGSSQFFGAMENWGAIYTFEHVLLLDPTISTQGDKQRIFSVQAHEMAHQWFGDLVTMSWWDDLWLNEGFATWMAARTTQKLHPEWNTVLESVGEREAAMSRDAVATTHPVVQHVATVEQASQAFDAITYEKGAAVIRMLEGYVGPDAWRSGVRSYMKQHAYGNTVSDDLWRAVETAAGKPILDIAHDFTLQPGVPLIRVGAETCSGGNTKLQLTQDEFTKDRPGKTSLKWRVPVIAQAVGGKLVRTLVTGGAGTLEVPGCGPVVVNAGQSGYYRTVYTAKDFASLRDAFAKLEPIDQLGLMGNTWALGLAGSQPASDYLDLINVTPANADPQIWGYIADNLQALNTYYRGDAARQKTFESFAIRRLAPVFARIGWEARAGESAPVTNLRTQLIATLGELGDTKVIAEAKRRYAAQDSDPKAVPPELRRTILGVVAVQADAATWDKLHAAARTEKTAMVKDQMYRLLSEAKNPVLAQRALDLALTDEPGATNSAGMVRVVSGEHPDMAFDYALAHREQLDKKVDTTSRSRYYPGLGYGSLDAAMIGKIQAYADKYIAASSRRDAETAIANIKYRMQVRNERLPSIDAWLAQHAK